MELLIFWLAKGAIAWVVGAVVKSATGSEDAETVAKKGTKDYLNGGSHIPTL